MVGLPPVGGPGTNRIAALGPTAAPPFGADTDARAPAGAAATTEAHNAPIRPASSNGREWTKARTRRHYTFVTPSYRKVTAIAPQRFRALLETDGAPKLRQIHLPQGRSRLAPAPRRRAPRAQARVRL